MQNGLFGFWHLIIIYLVLVMCQQRARRSTIVDDESEVLCLLGIARLILRCIPQAQMDDTSQPLVSEQEERVFKETRNCLVDLMDLLTVIPERNWSPVDLSDLSKSLKVDLIQPLTMLCENLPGGAELIPERLIETVDRFRFWMLDRYGWGLEWETNGYLGALQLALKTRRYDNARDVCNMFPCLLDHLPVLTIPSADPSSLSFFPAAPYRIILIRDDDNARKSLHTCRVL